MKIVPFSELVSKEFSVRTLSASVMAERPFRTYRCLKNTRKIDRLFFILGGEFVIRQDGCDAITTRAGDVLYLPSDCEYTGEWTSEEISYLSCEFILADEDGDFTLSDKIFIALHDRGSVAADRIVRLCDVWTKGELGYRIKALSLFLDLLHYVALENVKEVLGRSYSDISAAILYLENNYIGDISVAELAKLCGMCESRLRSRFLEYAGMPPIRYRNYLRAKKAAELLASGEYTVSEAAELVGIPDVAYFNRVFKKFCGSNPGEVRRK